MGMKRILSSFSSDPAGIVKYLRLTAHPGVSENRPIFVVGPPRSGTTMLYTRLLSCDGFCGPSNETGFFMITNPYGIPMDPMPRELWTTLVKSANSRAQLFDGAMEWFKDNTGAKFFVEKTPQHCRFYKTIRATWPEGTFVAIIRHPFDCVASAIRNSNFIPQGKAVESAARYWTRCAASIHQMTNDQRVMVVRYEEFVGSTDHIRDVVDFVSDGSLDYRPAREVSHAFVGKQGFELLTAGLTEKQVGRWKEELSDEQTAKIWDISEKMASRFGYMPS